MIDYNKEYTLIELELLSEENGMGIEWFDNDDYNFYVKCFTYSGFSWFFSGVNGNSLYLKSTKIDLL